MKSNASLNRLLPRGYYLVVFVIALCFRLILLVGLQWEDHIIDSYDNIAIHMLDGIGFSYNGSDPTVCRAPSYPTYLAAIFSIFGYKPIPFVFLRLFDLILDSFTAVIVLYLAVLWLPKLSRICKLGSGIVYAINPFIAYYTVKLGPETLYIFFYVIYLVILHKVLMQQKYGWIGVLSLGISGGILMLNKSIFLPLVLLIPIIVYFIYRDLRSSRWVLKAAIAVLVSYLVALPWAYRSTKVAQRFVPIQTLTGYIFWYDFVMDSNRNQFFSKGEMDKKTTAEGFITLDNGEIYYPYNLSAQEDARYDKEMIDKALKWIIAHPSKFLLKIVDNLFSFWYFVETPKKMIVSAIFSLFFILVALGGIVINLSLSHRYESIFFLVIIGLIDLIYTPIIGIFRHSLLTYPMLSLLAGSTLGLLWDKFIRQRKGSLT